MQAPFTDPELPALRRALLLQKSGEWEAAEAAYREILMRSPQHPMALHLLGVVLLQTDRAQEGAAHLRQSVALQPLDPLAWNNLATAFKQLGDLNASLEACDRALALQPTYVLAWCNRGELLFRRDELTLALEAYDRALALAPSHLAALIGRGTVLTAQARAQEALSSAELAVCLAPDDYDAHRSLGAVLWQLQRLPEAAYHLERARQIKPGSRYMLGALMYSYMRCCEWHASQDLLESIETHLQQNEWIALPFVMVMVGCTSSASLLRRCAELQMQAIAPTQAPLALSTSPTRRLRIAYLSADFHTHATAYLITELFELHDRGQFEVLAVSFGPDDTGPLRARIVAAADRFVRVNDMTDAEVAAFLVAQQVGVVVDLKGFTRDSRPGIFQYRPAPIIVNYLGYPGTMGAACYDYIIGDPVVTPMEHAEFYSEKIVQLPHSYQVNDRQRLIAPDTPVRRQQGLPDEGFVFACFNNNYKITPKVFDVWMRLLVRVDGSVLWLLADNDAAVANLRREAAARGVASDRLVFAPRAPLPEHLARHRLADIFLDTLPCNAHTTASDALWAGLPVLTCLGTTFAGRVAASLLTAIGLPELIASSLDAYEALAFQLATEPARLQAIRQKLCVQRDRAPLFDTPLFTAHLEKAYLQMAARYHQGLAPASMAIPESESSPLLMCVSHDGA